MRVKEKSYFLGVDSLKEAWRLVVPVTFRHGIYTWREARRNRRVTKWALAHCSDPDVWMRSLNPTLYDEACTFAIRVEEGVELIFKKDGVSRFGGPAFIKLLFFLVRHFKCEKILETGVAAGWSSWALLEAIHRNGYGRLFSSDLPYNDSPVLSDLVGMVVPNHIRSNWELCKSGDSVCVPKFLDLIDHIDLYHYDSAKDYESRSKTLSIASDKITSRTTVVFDDISDNSHFRDYVDRIGRPYYVFRMKRKFIGVVPPDL
jgi:predicted O-methyltransferase YrrM